MLQKRFDRKFYNVVGTVYPMLGRSGGGVIFLNFAKTVKRYNCNHPAFEFNWLTSIPWKFEDNRKCPNFKFVEATLLKRPKIWKS